MSSISDCDTTALCSLSCSFIFLLCNHNTKFNLSQAMIPMTRPTPNQPPENPSNATNSPLTMVISAAVAIGGLTLGAFLVLHHRKKVRREGVSGGDPSRKEKGSILDGGRA